MKCSQSIENSDGIIEKNVVDYHTQCDETGLKPEPEQDKYM